MGLSLRKNPKILKTTGNYEQINLLLIIPPAPISRASSWYTMLSQPYTSLDGLSVRIHHTVGRERESRGREDTQNVLAHCSLMQAPPQLMYLLKGCDLFPFTSVLPHTISRSPPLPLLPRSALPLLLLLSQGPPSVVNSPSSSRSLLSAGITGMDHPAWFSHLKCKLPFQNIFFSQKLYAFNKFKCCSLLTLIC